jgi:hypothetical protein
LKSIVLYQGMTSVVPQTAENTSGLHPLRACFSRACGFSAPIIQDRTEDTILRCFRACPDIMGGTLEQEGFFAKFFVRQAKPGTNSAGFSYPQRSFG